MRGGIKRIILSIFRHINCDREGTGMKRNGRRVFGIMACLMLSMALLCTTVAFAEGEDGPKSLDEVAGSVTTSTPADETGTATDTQATTSSGNTAVSDSSSGSSNATGTSGTTSTQQEATEFMEALQDASKLDVAGAEVTAVTKPIVKYSGMIVQIIAVIITVALSIRVAIDLLYIVAPFSRKLLANGHMGNPMAGTDQMAQPGMSGGMGMGGMGGYGGGYGRYGGGYGMGGMGGMGGMNGGMVNRANMMAQNDIGSRTNRIQWVSGAALNAVAAENTVGPDGKAVKPLVQYAKDSAITLIATPILLVLLLTGAFQNIGFALGEALSNMISNISV